MHNTTYYLNTGIPKARQHSFELSLGGFFLQFLLSSRRIDWKLSLETEEEKGRFGKLWTTFATQAYRPDFESSEPA